ncbi:hypothetical protein JZ785_03685 [Alicyclobacillus curvatus]|nr:hypothetical protein JZ785_03685 [Alicyclobacillus curvatus]
MDNKHIAFTPGASDIFGTVVEPLLYAHAAYLAVSDKIGDDCNRERWNSSKSDNRGDRPG